MENDNRYKTIRKIAEQSGEIVKEYTNGVIVRVKHTNELLLIRTGGVKTIDIHKVSSDFVSPSKADGVKIIANSSEMKNLIFLGNEMNKGGRDSSIKRDLKTNEAKVIGVEREEEYIQPGVVLLSKIKNFREAKNNSERSLLFLKKIIDYASKYESKDKQEKIFLAITEYFKDLGINYDFDVKEKFNLCFDIDDTLLEHKTLDQNVREGFSEDKKELKETIFKLWKMGFWISFVSDNSSENVMKRAVIPIIAEAKKEGLTELPPINVFSDGISVHLISYSDGEMKLNENFSKNHIISNETINIIKSSIGEVKEDETGNIVGQGILFEITKSLRENNGDKLLPNVSIRLVPGLKNKPVQFSISSNYFKKNIKNKVKIAVIQAAGEGSRLKRTLGTNSSKPMTKIGAKKYIISDIIDSISQLDDIEDIYIIHAKDDTEIGEVLNMTNKNVYLIKNEEARGALPQFALIKNEIGGKSFILTDCDIVIDKKNFKKMILSAINSQDFEEYDMCMLVSDNPHSFQSLNTTVNDKDEVIGFQKDLQDGSYHGGYVYIVKKFPYEISEKLMKQNQNKFSLFLDLLAKDSKFKIKAMHIPEIMDIDELADLKFIKENKPKTKFNDDIEEMLR